MECPRCKCTQWISSGASTGDIGDAWKDKDGAWHQGPASEVWDESCSNCGWTRSTQWENGKQVKNSLTK